MILRRRREWEGAQRLFWDAFAFSLLLWIVGELGFMYGELAEGRASWVRWHTMFSLCGGIGPMIAVFARPDRGVRKDAAAAISVDLASYGLLATFIYAYFLMVPSLAVTSAQDLEAVLLRLVEAHRLLLVSGFAAGVWLGRNTAWRSTYSRLLAGAAVGGLLRLATDRAIAHGRYYSGSIYDLAWIVPFGAYLWAAAKAPASPKGREGEIELATDAPSAIFSAIPVLLMPFLGYGLLRVNPIGEPGDSFRMLMTTLATVGGLGLLTLRLSVQSGHLQRADAQVRLMAAAIEQSGDLIMITRADSTVEHANDACATALGYSREDLRGKSLQDLLEHGFDHMVDHIGNEVRRKGIWRGTLLHRRSNGTTFPAASSVVALKDHQGKVTHFVGVERDITDDLRLRDQLVHSERLSAVGELVAGVAHELNNPLQTIIGSVELLIEEGKDSSLLGDLQIVRQEAGRAGQIVRNLLAFVRRSTPDRVVADLNAIVRATANLREFHLAQQNIALLTDLQPGPLPVLVNREEVQQVVLNLVINAEQAILSGSGSGTIRLVTRSDGASQVLTVADDGPGIRPELRGRVFEPFFTTKDVGQGTGLGLSLALGIASSHGGSLELCPEGPSPGACFRLTLPASATPVVEAMPPARVSVRAANGAESRGAARIVEDEDPVRTLLARLLRRRGYEVTEATSVTAGKRALDGRPFALVLCDVRLADGNGGECLRYIRTLRPEMAQRVVFVTGDATALAGGAGEFSDVPILPKPFTIADLDRVLAGLPAPSA